MGQLARRRFMRTMRTAPMDGGPPAGGGGGGNNGGQQNQGGGQQGAGGGGPPNNGGQQNQNQGGQSGGQQNQGGSVLDAARQGAGGFDGNQGGQQNTGQRGQQQGPLTAEDVARIVESAVDRRVNALNNPGGGRNRNQGNQNDGQGNGNGNQNGGDGGNTNVHRVDQGARREARLAFREYVGDQVRFLSDVERNAAVRIGTAAIAMWDGHGDADAFGKQVAGEVAATVQELGRMYERVTLEALRKQGRLKDDGQQGPGAGSGPAGFPLLNAANGFQLPTAQGGVVNQKNPQQAVSNAAALAAQYNQQAGHQPAQQATT